MDGLCATVCFAVALDLEAETVRKGKVSVLPLFLEPVHAEGHGRSTAASPSLRCPGASR